jgi:hypothetical protein
MTQVVKRTKDEFRRAARAYSALLKALKEGLPITEAQLPTLKQAVGDAARYAEQMTRIGRPRKAEPLSGKQRAARHYAKKRQKELPDAEKQIQAKTDA